MTRRPPTYPFFAFFRDFLRVFPEKKILYLRSRKQELREFGGYFSLKRAPALRGEILSGEFGREEHISQNPLTQGVLQAAIKKSGIRGLIRTGSVGLGHTPERSLGYAKASRNGADRRSVGNHTTSAGGARAAVPPHKREAERRFCAENNVFRAQKTETRRSAPPCIHNWGGRRDSNPRPPGPQPGALTN